MNEANVKQFYDEFTTVLMRGYLQGHGRLRAQQRFLRDSISPCTQSVLVIGCGAGDGAYFIAKKVALEARVLAVDISEKNIATAKKLFAHPRIEYRVVNVVEEPLEGLWDVAVLPDVYEHIPTESRGAMHANIASLLNENGKVLLTVPSPGYQNFLKERGWGLQIVDETVTQDDLIAMAKDLDASLSFFAFVNISRTNDYIHAVIERGCEKVEPFEARDRIPLKRQRRVLPFPLEHLVRGYRLMTRLCRYARYIRLVGVGVFLRQRRNSNKPQDT